ncbi:helix-turn-helix domain-containing protein, partial [Methylibium sp.]
MDTTFVKGLQVIEALATHPTLTGVTELAKHLGLTKSNAHRLLQTLVACGYVRNLEQSGKYELTLKLWELGAAVV